MPCRGEVGSATFPASVFASQSREVRLSSAATMRNLKLLAALMLCASLALLARAEEGKKSPPAKSDKEWIQGTWKVVKKTKGGEGEDVKDNPMTIKFAGDVATATAGGETKGEGTFTIDADKTPK